MFEHRHPYPPFIPEGCQKLIVGTLPPPRFSTGKLKEGDVDFCYGSRDGLLWPILERIYGLNLIYENSQVAIEQRKNLLEENAIGVCDIVEVAYRKKIDASDAGMSGVELRDLIAILQAHSSIDTLLFTGGNSKNGPEYHFRRLLKRNSINFSQVQDQIPRIHEFILPESERTIRTVSLTAPSGSANRAVGAMASYKEKRTIDPSFSTLDFRVAQYKPFFKGRSDRLP